MSNNENINDNITPSSLDRAEVRLKVCGMKYQQNIDEVSVLHPDYLGFIFYDKSPRNFTSMNPIVLNSIKKVGVFVDTSIENIIEKIHKFHLQAVQLHGSETPEFCIDLRERYFEECQFERSREQSNEVISTERLPRYARNDALEIIKVFSIKNEFDFTRLQPYEDVCDYYLFDTKGKEKGGNGYTFDWSVLKEYPSNKPYFLSGGIGLSEVEEVLSFLQRQESKYCYALDVNSKFEVEAGLKDVEQLKEFKKQLGHFE